MRYLRLPSRCRRSSCPYRGGFRAPAFFGAVSSENITNSSPIHHSYDRDLGLYNALGRAFLYPTSSAVFALCPLCFALGRLWCDHDYPRWDAHTMPICTCNTPVLGAPASIMGSEPQATGLRPFLCPSPMPQVHGAKLERRECRLGRVILSVAPAHDPEKDEWRPRSTASRPELMPSKVMTMCS